MIARLFQETGRPKNIYFRRGLREDLARHETLVTQCRLDLRPDACVRLWNVRKDLRPDAEMRFGSLTVHVELDTGASPYRKVVRRFPKYAQLLTEQELVAWVCLTEARMRGFMRRAAALNGKAVFTVLSTGTFFDLSGEKVTIQRSLSPLGNG